MHVSKFGVIVNSNSSENKEDIIRHEFTHIIQHYHGAKVEFDYYEERMLETLKCEFEAHITHYSNHKLFSGDYTKKSLMRGILSLLPEKDKTLILNKDKKLVTSDSELSELIKKGKTIISLLENVVFQASPDKLAEINKFIQSSKSLDEILGYTDKTGKYVKGLLRFL